MREYWIVDPVKKLVMVYDFENEDTEQYTFQDSIKVGIYEELRILLRCDKNGGEYRLVIAPLCFLAKK